ncbi:CD109 antigen-like [Sitodiplosis mosellana]|uniref:CD109 antigen-like n=1 Tax=Sitodiplosis mosellana TaxID=263140 RepID=UPI0024444F92|nr:CD109 antigen-like [Sitodiplosis mosellana]
MLRSKQKVHPAAKRSGKFNYTILALEKFRWNTDFTLSLTIHDAQCKFDEAILVRVSIEDNKDATKFQIHRNVAMNPNVTEVVSIPVGNVPAHRGYKLVVKGILGIDMEHQERLHLQTQSHIIFIQTDKAIYKPNDCVKFRVLVLDWELKAAPITKNELKIGITDPCQNLLKQWNGVNIANNSGVFSGEYQLSDLPNLGLWKITVSVGDQVKTATIKVAEYVLPKFKIEIESPGVFMPEDEKAHVVVRAFYTHGMPMKGTVDIAVKEYDDPVMEKSVTINGQETIEFDIKNELQFNHTQGWKCYKMEAKVTEDLTGLIQSCKTNIEIETSYDIYTNLKTYVKLEQGTTANITISVRKQNGIVPSFVDPSKRDISVIRQQFYDEKLESTKSNTRKSRLVHQLNDNGDVTLALDIDEHESKFSLLVEYASQTTNLGIFSTFAKFEITPNSAQVGNNLTDELRLETSDMKKKYNINKPVEMEVIIDYPIPSYTYVVVSRGKILESKTISPIFDNSYQSVYVHRFFFVPHLGYAPKATVTVYCVRDGLVMASSFTIELYDDFENFINLDFSQDMAKPGDIVEIEVKSKPNSFIGLLGIDRSALIMRGGNDLSHDEIRTSLAMANLAHHSYKDSSEFSNAGLICFSNAKRFIPHGPTLHLVFRLRGGGEGPPKPKVRKHFPETWIWDTIDGKNFNGSLSMKKTVPHSLTTWILTGFSIDPVNGLAFIKAPVKLCVQQPFHISLNLPYSVKRGEVVTIPCSVFNYLPNDIEAEVTLENENNEFEFADSATTEKSTSQMMRLQFRRKNLLIRSQNAHNAVFTIRPTRVGSISLKVSAVSSVASDCIVKALNVECEGVPQFMNKAVYIDLREKSRIDPIDLAIEFPEIALPDSQRIEITCVGDLLSGTIENLQQLIRLPCGCGEQNMLNFVPNIVVLNYLKNTQQLTGKIEAKAKKYMEIGYQRELIYKHKDGSFSAFGEYDKRGSTWLTAFVARSFQQASEHILIDNSIIDQALKWLSRMQSSNGSFVERGSIFDKEMQSGASNGIALTAYVLTAFLVNKESTTTYKTTIEKAIANIVKFVNSCNDVYALAVCAYALQLANHSSKRVAINRLMKLAKSNANYKWWDKSIKVEGYRCKESKTINVEVTAYALLTLMQNSENDSELVPILKWLLNQRNDRGGFEGTQDTIVGIEALANFATKIVTKENSVNISVTTSNDTKINFDVNKDNSLVLQSQKLTPDVKSVRVNATGKGFSLLELAYRYNINAPDAQSAFSLKSNAKLVDGYMTLVITSSYQPPEGKDSHKQSNMVILEIALPSGFVLNTDVLNRLKATVPTIKLIETKNSDTVAIIYFDYLTSDDITLKVVGFREYIVDEQKPTPIIIYDYYDNALSAREFYSL